MVTISFDENLNNLRGLETMFFTQKKHKKYKENGTTGPDRTGADTV